MPITSSSELPNPAVLLFQGLDFEATAAVQLRNIKTIRQMANLIFDCNEAITRRQMAFLKSEGDEASTAIDLAEGQIDPQTIFVRQIAAYGELHERLSVEIAGVAEITARCCSGLAREAASNMVEFSKGENTVERVANGASTGSQTGQKTKSAQG